MTAMNENIELMMPIKAAPYDHQKKAFAFACDKFGVFDERLKSRGTALLMEIVLFFRSTSDHRSASSSPRRRPQYILRRLGACISVHSCVMLLTEQITASISGL